jgi:hypothetical protein
MSGDWAIALMISRPILPVAPETTTGILALLVMT